MDSEQKPYEENDSLGESGYKREERIEDDLYLAPTAVEVFDDEVKRKANRRNRLIIGTLLLAGITVFGGYRVYNSLPEEYKRKIGGIKSYVSGIFKKEELTRLGENIRTFSPEQPMPISFRDSSGERQSEDLAGREKKTLERLIEERTQEAKDKDFYNKGLTISEYLGEYKYPWASNEKEKERLGSLVDNNNGFYLFENDSFLVVSEPNNPSKEKRIRIHSSGNLVFEAWMDRYESGNGPLLVHPLVIHSYVPGDWEKGFNELNEKAVQKKKELELKKAEEEKQRKEQERIEKAKRFGLEGQLKDE